VHLSRDLIVADIDFAPQVLQVSDQHIVTEDSSLVLQKHHTFTQIKFSNESVQGHQTQKAEKRAAGMDRPTDGP
jgi:hypothetical protein